MGGGDDRAEVELLDDNAPKAAAAVWDMLPIEDDAFAAKWSASDSSAGHRCAISMNRCADVATSRKFM